MVKSKGREASLELAEISKTDKTVATTIRAENLSQKSESETGLGGTVCEKFARTGLWAMAVK